MTRTLTTSTRAEAEWLSQPENRLTDDDCPMCNRSPCVCDQTTEALMDEMDWSEE